MIYLSCAIICSSMIAIIFKYAENKNMNKYVITATNYFVASIISLVMILTSRSLINLSRDVSFLAELKLVLGNHQALLSPYNSIIWGILIGSISGLSFFYSFLYYQKSVEVNGVSLSGTFSKLGILIPMIFSLLIWKEYPSTVQWLGIALSFVSILIVNLSFKSLNKLEFNKTILLLFFIGGLAEFSNKIYQKYAMLKYKDFFLFAVFTSAFIISFLHARKDNVRLKKNELMTGVAVGIPNLFSSYFLILSLETLSTSVAFPIFSAASIVLINLAGYFIFKEKLDTENKIAIILIILALVLINV